MFEERLSEQEAMDTLGCKKSKFYTLRRKHTFLQPVTCGKTRFFSKKDVEKVIELEKTAKAKVWATPLYRRRKQRQAKKEAA
nr:MAG TPA: excisionase [Caudoviricetes sp.]